MDLEKDCSALGNLFQNIINDMKVNQHLFNNKDIIVLYSKNI